MLLRCTLILPSDVDLAGYNIEVRVEDVSRADAPATVIASARCPATAVHRAGRCLGPILLDVTLPNPADSYTVRGLVSKGRSPEAGDMLSMRSIPVAEADELAVAIPLTLVQ
jgi:hypothetical protein